MAASLDHSLAYDLIRLATHNIRDAEEAALWLKSARAKKRPPASRLYLAQAVETATVFSY